MISGPQTYAKLSSVAIKFLKSKQTIVKPKVVEKYEYLAPGANIAKIEEESQIHKFLSQTALAESVNKEFGKAIDVLG